MSFNAYLFVLIEGKMGRNSYYLSLTFFQMVGWLGAGGTVDLIVCFDGVRIQNFYVLCATPRKYFDNSLPAFQQCVRSTKCTVLYLYYYSGVPTTTITALESVLCAITTAL